MRILSNKELSRNIERKSIYTIVKDDLVTFSNEEKKYLLEEYNLFTQKHHNNSSFYSNLKLSFPEGFTLQGQESVYGLELVEENNLNPIKVIMTEFEAGVNVGFEVKDVKNTNEFKKVIFESIELIHLAIDNPKEFAQRLLYDKINEDLPKAKANNITIKI